MGILDRGITLLEHGAGGIVSSKAKWLVVVLGLAGSVLLLAFAPAAETDVTPTSGLPDGAESTSVSGLQASLPSTDVAPAIVVFDRGGDRITRADLSAIQSEARALAPFSIAGVDGLRPVPAQDQTAVLVSVPMSLAVPDAELRTSIESIREELGTGLPEGLRAQVTGAPAYEVDLSAVFDGADVTLLLATVGVVALLLIVTYRSPWLWLVPLTVVGLGDQVAARLVAGGSLLFDFAIDESIIGITSVLVFGAGTNYALLLIARYREELRHVEDRHVAMTAAVRQAAPAILASSSTVVLALLSLALADTPSTRSLGYAGAIGIATAVLYALVCCLRLLCCSVAGCSGPSCRAWATQIRLGPGRGRGWAPSWSGDRCRLPWAASRFSSRSPPGCRRSTWALLRTSSSGRHPRPCPGNRLWRQRSRPAHRSPPSS
jgi:RND superfamily putative drug exporter